MNTDRLLKLADFLDKLPPERFDIYDWVGSDFRGDVDLSCGTTACAIGWATTIPEFRQLGLSLNIQANCYSHRIIATPVLDLGGGITLHGFDAAGHLFDITREDAYYLFDTGQVDSLPRDATPADVANRIREFVKTGRL
jgi:hypothetical protein